MSNVPPNLPAKRLPSAPPKIGDVRSPAARPPVTQQTPAPSLNTRPGPRLSASPEDAYVDLGMFQDIPRVLTVNEQPFYRWFRRVFLALIAMSAFIFGVSWFVKAPIELAGGAILISWAIVIIIALPDAIMPYKKTKFDLSKKTVKIGSAKPASISEINEAYLEVKGKNKRAWFGLGPKQGFWVPLTSSKFSMKHEDLLALRTVIPETQISNDIPHADLDERKVKKTQVSKNQVAEFIENLIA